MVAVTQVLIISILISVGYFLTRKQIFTEKTGKELSYLLVNFVTPMLIINSFQIDYTPEKMNSMLTAFALGFLSYAVVIAFSFLYCGKKSESKIERLSIIFSNAGFMGIPLVAGIYGEEGVFYASVMVIILNIVFWTYGITAVRGSFSADNIKKIVFSPCLISVVIGIVFFMTNLKMPEPFASVATHLANLNTPLAMIVSGISIAQSDIPAMLKKAKLYKIMAGKLLIAPMLTAVAFMLIPAPVLIKKIIVLQVACPAAAIVGIAVLQNGEDNRTATEYFSMTTLVSMATIPVIDLFCRLIF